MQKKVFEPTGLIPRSISRTVYRFFSKYGRHEKQAREILLAEFRRSRSQAIVSIQCLRLFLYPTDNLGAEGCAYSTCIQNIWIQPEQPIF